MAGWRHGVRAGGILVLLGSVLCAASAGAQSLASFVQTHDAALGYEFLNFYMQTPQAKALGQGRGEDRL